MSTAENPKSGALQVLVQADHAHFVRVALPESVRGEELELPLCDDGLSDPVQTIAAIAHLQVHSMQIF